MRALGFGAWVWRAPCLGLGARASDYSMIEGVELREQILKEAAEKTLADISEWDSAKLRKVSRLTLRKP